MWKTHKDITSTMDVRCVKTELVYLLPLNSVMKLLWFYAILFVILNH